MPSKGAPRNFPMQGYLFGDNQLGVSSYETGLKPEKYELLYNSPILTNGHKYRLLNGKVIEINGTISHPAPEDRKPPGPSWDHFYCVKSWPGDPVPESEMLESLESARPI